MLLKITFSLAALISNLILYLLLMTLQNYEGLHLLFVAVRVILVTSVIMQILYAIGFIKIPSK
jgi:hypothetical protein